jgi:ribosomal protein S18 acetylase RimI-like enzyme
MDADFGIKVFLKAVDETRIVGSVRGSLSSGTCSIGRLIVHPAYQRKGIGTMLMKSMEKTFSGAERFELFTGTKSIDNIRLYRRLGYEIFGEEDLSSEVRLVFMVKSRDSRPL